MWNRPNITTSPLRPGDPSSASRAIARSQVARCESIAALETPVDPLVRKIAEGSSLLPTRGSGAVDAPSSQPGDGDDDGQAECGRRSTRAGSS